MCSLHSLFSYLLRKVTRVAFGVLLLSFSGCIFLPKSITEDRHAKIALRDSFGDSAQRVIYAQQNWTADDSLWFYTASQGSNLMPYDIFLHLEMPDSKSLFRSDENMNRLRYLPQKPSRENPDALPVGWVKNDYQGQSYIGFNCAACHTSQINYQGTAIRIDGSATLADMDLMMRSLADALRVTLDQPEKFERLARRALKQKYPAERERFRAQLAAVSNEITLYNRVNRSYNGGIPIEYGYARLDAFGRIYNRILEHLTPGDTDNHNPPNAPVSYSYLWDSPFQDFVEWNGVGDNQGKGPLLRNAGQAMGVFATFDLANNTSSMRVPELIRMERSLERLWSPKWEELAQRKALPPINHALAEQGRKVFEAYQCHGCHRPIERTDLQRRITARFTSLAEIGTDPLMVLNTLGYQGKSGLLEGKPINPAQPTSPRFGSTTFVLPALSLAAQMMTPETGPDQAVINESINANPIRETRRYLDFAFVDKDDFRTLSAYKARPLNGVWASAPYLHNGSVPSLYELFLPSCSDAEIAEGKRCRPNRFTVGTRELDPINVGFLQRDPAQYPGLFIFDTQLPGNSNKGHEYAAGVTPVVMVDKAGNALRTSNGKLETRKLPPVTESQRLALVEYLKTL